MLFKGAHVSRLERLYIHNGFIGETRIHFDCLHC